MKANLEFSARLLTGSLTMPRPSPTRAGLAAAALATTLLAPAARAALPLQVPHSGYLLDGADRPVDTTATMSFAIHLAPTGGTPVWSASSCSVPVRSGYFAVSLGGDCGGALTTDELPAGAERWLEVTVGAIALQPRQLLAPAPAALALAAKIASAGTINAGTNPLDWTQLKNVPAGLADGTDDGNSYGAAAGGGLALVAGDFSIAAGGVTNTRLAADAASLGAMTGGAFTQSASGGNFAIGTAAGGERLHVRRTDAGPIASFVGENHSAGDPATRVRIQDLSGNVAWFLSANNDGRFALHQGAVDDRLVVDHATGNVGIGSGAPGQRLSVAGVVESTSGGFRFPDGSVQATAAGTPSGGALAWTTIGANATAAANTGCLVNAASRVTLTLPATCAVGDVVRVVGIGAGGWTVAVPGGQAFRDVNGATSPTSLSSQSPGDELELLCVVANTQWKLSNSTNATLQRIVAYPTLKMTPPMTASDQPFVVPANVTRLRVKLWGAGGSGSDTTGRGGAGAYVFDEIPVTPNESLTVVVGQGGRIGANYGWGGGGFSAIKRGSTVLALAAGGGGAVTYAGGFGGCATGGGGAGPNPGGGATQTAGGTAGSGGQTGTSLQGGDGMSGTSDVSPRAYGGGGLGYWQSSVRQTSGGGGGYFGGGGSGERSGGADSSGGGASSFWSAAGTCTPGGSLGAAPNTGDGDYAAGVAVGGGTTANAAGYPGGNGRVVIY